MPSGVVSGDFLLVYLANTGASTTTAPSGWTSLVNSGSNGSIWWKKSDGTEGASQTFGYNPGRSFSAAALRITGWDQASTPAFADTPVSASTTFDPPNVAPSWGSADNLFLASAICGASGRTASTAPTNYSSVITSNTNGGSVIVYSRNLTAASDDPSAYTLSGSGTGSADTIAIKPAATVTTYFFNQPMLGM